MEWNGNIDDGRLHRAVIGPGSGTDKLRQLLRTASSTAIDSSDPAGYTILMAAIKGGKSDRAVMLIDSGADITPLNASGWSAFHWAASINDAPVLNRLAHRACDLPDGLATLRHALASATASDKRPSELCSQMEVGVWLERLAVASDAELELQFGRGGSPLEGGGKGEEAAEVRAAEAEARAAAAEAREAGLEARIASLLARLEEREESDEGERTRPCTPTPTECEACAQLRQAAHDHAAEAAALSERLAQEADRLELDALAAKRGRMAREADLQP